MAKKQFAYVYMTNNLVYKVDYDGLDIDSNIIRPINTLVLKDGIRIFLDKSVKESVINKNQVVSINIVDAEE